MALLGSKMDRPLIARKLKRTVVGVTTRLKILRAKVNDHREKGELARTISSRRDGAIAYPLLRYRRRLVELLKGEETVRFVTLGR